MSKMKMFLAVSSVLASLAGGSFSAQAQSMSAGSEQSFTKEVDKTVKAKDADPAQAQAGVTGTMSCQAFIDMIAVDYKNSVRSHTAESNRPLQEHTSQMMVLLQKYAVVDEKGKPLDYSWSFLVGKTGDYCQAHPQAQLNDAILSAGQAMFKVVKEAKAKMDADRKKDAEAVKHNMELNTPPSGLPE